MNKRESVNKREMGNKKEMGNKREMGNKSHLTRGYKMQLLEKNRIQILNKS